MRATWWSSVWLAVTLTRQQLLVVEEDDRIVCWSTRSINAVLRGAVAVVRKKRDNKMATVIICDRDNTL